MRFKPCVRTASICVALLLAMVVFPSLVVADECNANVEHVTFKGLAGLKLKLFEGNLECVDLVVDDRTFPNGFKFTIQQMNEKMGDSIVFFNKNDGPRNMPAANICVGSDGDPANGTLCSATPHPENVTSENLDAGIILFASGGGVIVRLDSASGEGGGTFSLSDTATVTPTPEPGTLGLLGVALLALGWRVDRRLRAKSGVS
jgi:hypothetical protein